MRFFLKVAFSCGRIVGQMERVDRRTNRMTDAALGARRAYDKAIAVRLTRARRDALDEQMDEAVDAVRTSRARLTLVTALLAGGGVDKIEAWLERQGR